MEGPLLQQIMAERKDNMPREVTLVFGHTHKPFAKDRNFSGYPQWVNVYNTGGWVVESVEPQKFHGGSVVLVDDKYHATSISMYSEAAEPGGHSVSVKNAAHEGETANPLYEKIKKYIEEDPEVWDAFSAEVVRSIERRRENLRKRINEGD